MSEGSDHYSSRASASVRNLLSWYHMFDWIVTTHLNSTFVVKMGGIERH